MKNKWNILFMIGMIISTLILSPVGIILGLINVKNPKRKGQSIALIIIGVIMTLLWVYHFTMHHHHHHH